MKRGCILLIVFLPMLGGLAVNLSGQVDTDAAIKTKIAALEELWLEALKAKDTKAIDTVLYNGVLLVNDDGSVQTKAEFLSSLKDMFRLPTSQQQQFTLDSLNVRVFGTTAIAIGTFRVKGVERGVPYQRRNRFLDTWKYKGGAWAIVGTEATPILR